MTGWVECLVLILAAAPGTAGVGPGAGADAAVPVRRPPVAEPGGPATLRPAPEPAGGDRWVAEDKTRHLTFSFAATGIGYGVARFAVDPGRARAGAAMAAGLLGVGKELVDARSGGRFSVKDLAWDAVGVALGYIFVQRIE